MTAAVLRLAGRQVWRGGLIVLAVVAVMPAVVAATYASTVGADPAALAALVSSAPIRTLFGEPVALDTPGGFAVWRTGTVLAVLVSVWALLAATRITRGQEEAGRWDLLLAGRLRIGAVVAAHLAVPVVLLLAAGTSVTLALTWSGAGSAGGAAFGAGIAAIGVFFVGAGGLAAQVFTARGAATGASVAVLGAALLSRMAADGIPGLHALHWFSPLGLLALARPYEQDRALPLLVLAGSGFGLLATAVAVAAHRDLGSGLVPAAPGRSPRLVLLGSLPAFALRRAVRPTLGWAAGIGAYFLAIGLLARTMVEFLTRNPLFGQAAAQAGFGGLDTVRGYAATLFELLAVPVGVFTAVELAGLTAEESRRRLTLIWAGPVTRTGTLLASVATALAGAAVLLATAGVTTWLGGRFGGDGVDLPQALAGAANGLPVVLLSLGAAILAAGWAPGAVLPIGSLPSAGGFLWLVLAQSFGAPAWVQELSPFAHVAAVPFEPVDWAASAVMTGIAFVLAAAGLAGYRRRDARG